MTTAEIELRRQLYSAGAEELRKALVDIAEGLSTQLFALHRAPSAGEAERVAANLAGAQRALLRYADALHKEGID